jgi:Fe-S cluster assembly ATPase SufC
MSTTYVLRAAVNATRTHRGLEELDATDFVGLLKDKMNLVQEGRIVKSGDKQLARVLEQQGYRWIEEQVNGSEVVRFKEGTFAP